MMRTRGVLTGKVAEKFPGYRVIQAVPPAVPLKIEDYKDVDMEAATKHEICIYWYAEIASGTDKLEVGLESNEYTLANENFQLGVCGPVLYDAANIHELAVSFLKQYDRHRHLPCRLLV